MPAMTRTALRTLLRFGRPARPTRIVKRDDGVDFIADLLERIDLKHVAMHEVEDETEPCFYVRHDVDKSLARALDIARVEHAQGYRSTFFLLTPGSYGEETNYYGTLEGDRIHHDPKLVDHCKTLLDLGHEIGFHSDLVSLSIHTGRAPGDLLADEVEYFQQHGIPFIGTAAHGSPLARQKKYNNRELFEGCIRKGWTPGRTIEHRGRTVRLHSLRLEDFGFRYEAYSLPRDSRFSESGGRWGGRIAGDRFPREEMAEHFDLARFRSLVERANAANGVKAMSVMTHPCYWKAS
jgi:hypothetical protein